MPKQRREWGLGDPAISIVGDQFCSPYPMELVVKRKIVNLYNDHYDVFDVSGNLLLQVDGNAWGLKRKRVMKDANGFTILTMREKALTMKHEWKVYEGERKKGQGHGHGHGHETLLFSAQQPHSLTFKTSLDLYLPDNLKKDVCDFRALGNYTNMSFKVRKGDSIIADVAHRFSWGSFCKGKYNFHVKVNPEVDYAFIVAILVIIDDNENLC